MKKHILYFLILLIPAYKLRAQGDNNFQIGYQYHFYSDWKKTQPSHFIQPCLSYTYNSKEKIFFSSEVSWASFQRNYDASAMHFNNKRSIINIDNNIGYRFIFLKNGSLSFNLSAGLSFRRRNEGFITYGYKYYYYYPPDREYLIAGENYAESGYNIKGSLNKKISKNFNICLLAVVRGYSKGPSDYALAAEVGCMISDLPLQKEKELFNSSSNIVTIGLQSHYFPGWNLPGKYAIKSNIPIIGNKQLNLSYTHYSENNLVYNIDLSSSSYYNANYTYTLNPNYLSIFNIDNNIGYRFHIKEVPTLSLTLSTGLSIRRRHDAMVFDNNYYYQSPLGMPFTNYYPLYIDTLNSMVKYDLGCNLKAELDKRINKYLVIGASVVYRDYLWSLSDIAFGCHIGFLFGYPKKYLEN